MPKIGDIEDFYIEKSPQSPPYSAELRGKMSQDGWTFYIWVDSLYVPSITDEMVTRLGLAFMSNSESDIFSHVRRVYGDPWGSHSFGNGVISPSRKDIHVLLFDIDGDASSMNSGSFAVGYYWHKDNLYSASDLASNERLMFYLDAPLFSAADSNTPGGEITWDITDHWPSEVVSTLAHEFMHMIEFYQRMVRHGPEYGMPTWLNELGAMAVEEIVSRDQRVLGPRGVDFTEGSAGPPENNLGRLCYYNGYYSSTSLIDWAGNGDSSATVLSHYAISYALGAFILRVYGEEALTAIMQSSQKNLMGVDYGLQLVQDGVSTVLGRSITYQEILRRAAVAMLVSNDTKVPSEYRINTGDWIQGTIGSVNAHNYMSEGSRKTGPNIYPVGSKGEVVNPYTSRYFQGEGSGVAGSEVGFNLPEDVCITILVDS